MKKISFFTFLAVCLTACAPKAAPTLTVLTHDSFMVSEQVITDFEQANQVEVAFLGAGDAGEVLNKAILSQVPLADILYGVDNTFLSRAIEADIFEPYQSPMLANLTNEFMLDPGYHLLPVDYGYVCINYDKAWFASHDIPLPTSLEELLEPEYSALLVVENPSTSSPGLAFLLATIAHFGDPGYLDYWQALRENGVVVVDGWETAYYTNFSASSGQGPQPMVVSYATSPAAEVVYASQPLNDSPTASIIGPDTCFQQVEFAGILAGTANHSLARKFIDFLLDIQFQEDIPLQMFMYPVNPQAALPEAFTQYALIPEQAAILPPDEIAANRERWIDAWIEVVLK